MSNHQWESDFTNPSYYQEEEAYYTDAEADAFYNPQVEVQQPDLNAGIEANPVDVAKAMVESILRGWINKDDNSQGRMDAVTQIITHHRIKHCGVFESWIDRAYVDSVFELAAQLIARSTS